jgi:two-component system, chemotaxis family, chemotaxis protein CheY
MGTPICSSACPGDPSILVVDDVDETLLVVSAIARNAGFEVITARNGRDALQLLRAGLEPAAVITDVEMPIMGGLELLASIREAPALSGTPVIVHSALPIPSPSDQDPGDAPEAWVNKREGPHRLLAAIRRVA